MPDPFIPPIDPSYSLPPQQFDDRDDDLLPDLLPLPPQAASFDALPLPVSLQTQFESPFEPVNMPFVDQQAVEQLEYLDKISVRWNLKLILGGPLLLMALVVAGFYSRRHFREKWQGEWRQAAIEATAVGDERTVVSRARSVLRLDPDDAEMRLLLARGLLHTASSAEEYEEGVERMLGHLGDEPGDRQNRLELIEAAKKRGQWRWILTDALAPVRDSIATDPEFREIAIQCHTELGENSEAARVLLKLIDSKPSAADSYRRVLKLIDSTTEPASDLNGLIKDLDAWRVRYPENREIPEIEPRESVSATEQARLRILENQAATVLNRMGGEVDPFWAYSLAMAQHYADFENIETALAQWQEARKVEPREDLVISLGLEILEKTWQKQLAEGDAWRARQTVDDALQLLAPGLQREIPRLDLFEVQARLLFHRQEHRQARESCRSGLRALASQSAHINPSERKVRESLLRLTLAESMVGVISESTDLEAAELIGEWQENREALTGLGVPGRVLRFVDLLRDIAAGHLGKAVTGLARMRQPTRQQKSFLLAHIDWWLCECNRTLARREQLQRSLERAVADGTDRGPARHELQRLAIRDGLERNLFTPNDPIPERDPTPFDVEQLLANQLHLPPAQRVWTKVDAILKSLLALRKDDPAVFLLQAERWIAVNEWNQAQVLLEEARAKFPGDGALAEALIRLTRLQPDLEKSVGESARERVLAGFLEQRGDGPETRQLRALAWGLGTPDTKLPEDKFQELWAGTDGWSKGQLRDMAGRLLTLTLRSRDDALTVEAGRRGLDSGVRDVRLLAGAAAAAIRLGNDRLTVRSLQAIRRLEGEGGPWGNLLESYQVLWPWTTASAEPAVADQRDRWKQLQEVLRKLDQATELRPAWAHLHRLRGVARGLWGDADESVAAFQIASQLGDDSLETRVSLVDNLFRQQRDQELQAWSARRQVGSAFALLNLFEEDRIVTLRLGTEETQAPRRQLMELQLAIGRGEEPKVLLPQLEALTTKFPSQWQAWRLRINTLLQIEGEEEAWKRLTKLVGALPVSPPHLAPLVEALGAEVLGRQSEAEAGFRKACQAETGGFESVREYLGWCLREGRYGDISAVLDLSPDLAKDPLSEGFREWGNVVRLASGASVATSLADFETHLQPLDDSLEGLNPMESRHEVWFDCLSRSKSPRHRRKSLEWLGQRRDLVGLSSSRMRSRIRVGVELGDDGLLSQVTEDLQQSRLDPESASVILGKGLSNPEVYNDLKLLATLDQAFEILRRREPGSLRTAAAEAAIFTARQFPLDASAAYDIFRKRLARRTPAEMLLDLARAGRLNRLKSRLADVEPANLLNAGAWGILDQFPSEREVIVSLGECPRLAPLWQETVALDCLRNEVTLLVALGIESIRDVEGARDVLEGFGKRSPVPQDRFELPLFLARQGEFSEAQQLVNQMSAGPRLTEADLALCMAHLFESTTVTIENWNVPFRRLNTLRKDLLSEAQTRDVRFSLALLRGMNGQEDEAIDEYRQLLRNEPRHLVLMNNLAWFLGFSGQNLPEARQLAEELVSTHGDLPELLDTRGSICLLQGDLDQARRDFEQAVFQGNRGIYSAHLALCLARQKEGELAEKHALKALRMGFRGHHWVRLEDDAWGEEFAKLTANLTVSNQERIKANQPDTDEQNRP